MQNAEGMTFLRRTAAAAGISLILTFLLMLIFQMDAPQGSREVQEAAGSAPTLSEPGIRPISLR